MPGNCFKCAQPVYHAEEKRANGRIFHAKCFKCSVCGKNLNSTNITVHKDELYCKICYGRHFGPTGYGSRFASTVVNLPDNVTKEDEVPINHYEEGPNNVDHTYAVNVETKEDLELSEAAMSDAEPPPVSEGEFSPSCGEENSRTSAPTTDGISLRPDYRCRYTYTPYDNETEHDPSKLTGGGTLDEEYTSPGGGYNPHDRATSVKTNVLNGEFLPTNGFYIPLTSFGIKHSSLSKRPLQSECGSVHTFWTRDSNNTEKYSDPGNKMVSYAVKSYSLMIEETEKSYNRSKQLKVDTLGGKISKRSRLYPVPAFDGIRTSNVPMTAEAHVVPKQLSIKYRMLAFPPNVITYKSDKSTLANPPCDVHYPVRVTHIPRRVWINTSDTDLDIYQTYNLLIPDED